jgi:hypothetical protein
MDTPIVTGPFINTAAACLARIAKRRHMGLGLMQSSLSQKVLAATARQHARVLNDGPYRCQSLQKLTALFLVAARYEISDGG